MADLTCPRCHAGYPRWRLLLSSGTFRCLSCGARLTISRGSARKMGTVGGLTLCGVAMLSGLVFGSQVVWTWRFLALFLVFSFLLGQIIRSIVGVLVLRDDFR